MRDGDKSIYVKLISPNSFEYGVGESEDGVETINVIKSGYSSLEEISSKYSNP